MNNFGSELIFFVNGKKIVEKRADPEWTLLYYLRNKLQLCGTKLGCGEGGCGACTVMVSQYNRKLQAIKHLAVNACLAPICSMHGFAITTVEGIGSTKTKLHPVQERIAKSHGTQCGFCTPGTVMSMYTLLRTISKPNINDLEVALQGNLCRCTGYRPIIEGYKSFTEDWEVMQNGQVNGKAANGSCMMGDNCCKNQKNGNVNGINGNSSTGPKSKFAPYDATQEPIFPPELKLYDTLDTQNLKFQNKDVTWYRPVNLATLLDLKLKHPEAKLVGGNTEVGIEVKFKHMTYPVLIQTTHIPELSEVRIFKWGLEVGASVSLQDLEDALKNEINLEPELKTRLFAALVDMLQWFAGKQIRNVATVGGNIMTGSPVSDLNPIFMACNVELKLQSKTNGTRKVKMDDRFFVSYRKTLVKGDEILLSVSIPYTSENQYVYAYKQSRRRDDDIAIVNSAVNVIFEPNTSFIQDINLAFGGMAPTTVTSFKTRQSLLGKPWNSEMLETAYQCLLEDLPLQQDAPGGMVQYRKSLTLGFFFKAYLQILDLLQGHTKLNGKNHTLEAPKSSQYFHVQENHEKTDTVGRPIVHMSAYKHSTGEAVYCDDMPRFSNELYMALVLSTKAHAKILLIDASKATQMEGVHAFISAKDIPVSRNKICKTRDEEVVFVSETVTSQGQVLGAIIAEDQATAQKAARQVQVEYEELQPIIVSIEDAIKHNSFFKGYEEPKVLQKGDVDEAFRSAPHVTRGECSSGGQDHFYLETQCTIAVPKNEDGEIEIYCSTQYPAVINKLISRALGISQNKVVVKVKRVGGGFGGKENQPAFIALPAALAASSLGRPVRCMLNRDEDILITGGRHSFYMEYKIAFDNDGKILACDVSMYANAGYSIDVSPHVLERAIFHLENVYKIPCVRIKGYLCKTNLPSNMAFRGFGAPQAMLAGEFMIRSIAEYLHKDAVQVAKTNLYEEGDLTPYNQTIEYCTIGRCWNECLESSNMMERRKDINKYNRENRWKKRGISLVPTKYGVAFHTMTKNQAGALLHVYTDGSVLLSHGGVEMGQGLHTKMIQIASRVLEIPVGKILISETATDKVPNTSATAASISSDLNGMAVLNACEIIKERLAPYKKANPGKRWEDWVQAAYVDRISLSTTGFHKTPFPGYDWKTNSGSVFHYFTYGVACSEVEIDCLTGDHRVLRTDIVMDVGESLNPAIDVGQIEGAFMQGYGLFMLEEMVFGKDGSVLTRGPSTYKIPSVSNIPLEFNVSLLKGAPNPKAIYSSKAVGEPPLFLASSILFAVREAIKAARLDAGVTNSFNLDAPVTCEKIRMGCQDHLTAKLEQFECNSSH